MAKKPRSQRRKKGGKLSTDGGCDDSGDENSMDAHGNTKVEFLQEDFTIADSVDNSQFSFGDSNWGDDDDDENGGGGGNGAADDDAYLSGAIRGDAASTAAAAAESRWLKLQAQLQGLDEFSSEKRSAKREASLRRLFKTLTQFATGPAAAEAVWNSSRNIQSACLYSMRNGPPAEQYAACRVLEATSVVLGHDQDDWCELLDKPLRMMVNAIHRAVPVRQAALRALSMAVFVCATDSMTTESLCDLCEQVALPEYRNETVSPSLRATALDCWGLLATTMEDFYLAGQDDTQMGRGLSILELLRDCLNHGSSIELRSAAGECVALIHESRLALGIDDTGEADQTTNTTARRYQRGSWEGAGSPFEDSIDEIRQRVAELAVESGHHLSKKAKKEQRATFREFQATIVDDESPEEVVNFRNCTLELSSWREIIQLNFIRHCLQGGFQIQLLLNETLQVMFESGLVLNTHNSSTSGGMSQLEKRLILSKGSEAAKKNYKKLKGKRDKREHIKNHFIEVDGEDDL